MLEQTYFSVGNLFNPGAVLDRLLNGYRNSKTIAFQGNELSVLWTRRAGHELRKHSTRPLTVEMQLYFSCVIKKRVLFYDTDNPPGVTVNENLNMLFRPVQATSCDPVEFASNYPVKTDLTSPGARKMHPRLVKIDFRDGEWSGEFEI